MHLYSTLSQKKERLEKPRKRPLNLFVCGPTVYDDAHLGHARTYLTFDIFVRYLRSKGWNVFYLQNITDVDDKIIKRARETNVSPLDLAKKYEREYYADIKKLGVSQVNSYARASDYIPEIVSQIQTLIRKKHAYAIEECGYYFDISTHANYGALSKRSVVQAEDAISRIDVPGKRNKGDFALWKLVETRTNADTARSNADKKKFLIVNGEPAWNTPLGWGRPGWHIEDTAITEKHFGSQYDLHGGGIDLAFPHHEAEIAQQESASGMKPFVKIWMHTGFLTVGGQKMSKSLKNFITIKDFLKNRSPETLRFMVASHHYRSPFDCGEKTIENAENALQTLTEFLAKLALRAKTKKWVRENASEKSPQNLITRAKQEFESTLQDDFNTPEALASLFELTKEMQTNLWNRTPKEAQGAYEFLSNALKTLGFTLHVPSPPRAAQRIVRERELSRRNKQFAHADALRKKLEGLGYKVEDTPLGPLCLPT